MNNKTIGAILLVASIIVGSIFLSFISSTEKKFAQACSPKQECMSFAASLNLSHLAVGIIFAIFSLGIYLIIFTRAEEALLKKLMQEQALKTEDERLKLMSRALDTYETQVLQAIRNQPGITQNMLPLRTTLSKAKVSQILTDFEKKSLVVRKVKGKTYSIFLRESI